MVDDIVYSAWKHAAEPFISVRTIWQRILWNFLGDTVEIVPLFSNEAKKQATSKMNPTKSKTKWKNTIMSTNQLYVLSDDAISIVFNATKGEVT